MLLHSSDREDREAPAGDPPSTLPATTREQAEALIREARCRTTKRVGAIDGSALPSWSANGRDLMYESNDGLWLMPVATGKPVEIVHPLYSEADWNSKAGHLASISFYGQIPWQYQFSWWSPTGGR